MSEEKASSRGPREPARPSFPATDTGLNVKTTIRGLFPDIVKYCVLRLVMNS